jgi:stage II sporulation protein D
MKTLVYYFLLVISILIFLPLLIIKSCNTPPPKQVLPPNITNINVLIHATGQTVQMPMNQYLKGVVAAEMPAEFDLEALKAQAVAARTYAAFKIKKKSHPLADVCTDFAHCQAWINPDQAFIRWPASKRNLLWNKVSTAVDSTKNEMVYYKGKLANPLFHSNSGGQTENCEDVWDGVSVPYLRSVKTHGEEKTHDYLSITQLSTHEIIQKMQAQYPDFAFDKHKIKINKRSKSKRVISITFGNKTLKGTEIRKALGLKSTNFYIEKKGNLITFEVKGYGHGVGMSQDGANVLAKKGMKYQQILKYYYRGVEVR